MRIVRVARQASPRFLRPLAPGEDGDAVPGLLAVPDRLVAGLADGLGRELLVDRLQLLKAGDVRLRGREPVEKDGQPCADAVDVVGGDLHADILPRAPPQRLSRSSPRGKV